MSVRSYHYEALIKLIQELRAEAWDEGFDAGHQAARAVNKEWPALPPNPYREAKVTAWCDTCRAFHTPDASCSD